MKSAVPDTAPISVDEDARGLSALTISGLVVGSVGLAGLTAGVVFVGLTAKETSEAESDPALCPDKVCSPRGREAIERADTYANVANVALGVGGGVALTGVVLFAVGMANDGQPRTALSSGMGITAQVGPRAVGVVISGAID